MIDEHGFRTLEAAVAAAGRTPSGWTRPPWTPALRQAEKAVIEAATAIGLTAAEHDPAGNLWLRDPAAPQTGLIATGSHLDTVPDGGAFDGALGVVCAIAAVGGLRRAGVPGAERLAVVAFADEEGWRFGTPIFGSRMLCGRYGADVLDRVDGDGVRLGDVGPTDPLGARGLERQLAAFVEVHIEQGRELAPAGVALGVATVLAARRRIAFTLLGASNHAGTTPMAGRRDALVAAARLVLTADEEARRAAGTVATVGQLVVEPGGSNVICGRAHGTLDVRAGDAAARDALVAAIAARVPEAQLDELASDPGARFDERVRAALFTGAAAASATAADLASFAGHDAGVLAAAGVPAGMLFVRSPDGVSHHPSEHAEEGDRLAGCRALETALESLLETFQSSPEIGLTSPRPGADLK